MVYNVLAMNVNQIWFLPRKQLHMAITYGNYLDISLFSRWRKSSYLNMMLQIPIKYWSLTIKNTFKYNKVVIVLILESNFNYYL